MSQGCDRRGGHSIGGPLQHVQQSGSRKRVIEDVKE